MHVYYNPNPAGKRVGDCVVRAIAKLEGMSWNEVLMDIFLQAFRMKDMPSSNAVWGAYLKSRGYRRRSIPNTCPDCYTVRDFCQDNPRGQYLLATGSHVVAAVDGDYYDTWDSGEEIPVYFFERG